MAYWQSSLLQRMCVKMAKYRCHVILKSYSMLYHVPRLSWHAMACRHALDNGFEWQCHCLPGCQHKCMWFDFERTRAWLGAEQACCSLHNIGRSYLEEGMGMGVRFDSAVAGLVAGYRPPTQTGQFVTQRSAPTPHRRQRSPRLRKCPRLSW